MESDPESDEQKQLRVSAKIEALREVQAFIESTPLACAAVYDFIELRISSYLAGDLD